MRRIILHNQSHPEIPPIQASYCDTFLSRFRGLMLHPGLAEHEGLLLVESKDSRINAAIHMLFMNFDLAVVWINSAYQVVDVQIAHRWRPSYTPSQPARFILETRPEYAHDFHVGDRIAIKHA